MTLSLFEGYGIEIETMVVDAGSLDVRPIADELLREASGGGEYVEDFDDGPIGWSNELVTHVLEMKTNGPVPRLDGVAAQFEGSLRGMEERLAAHGARFMPTAMHPWMDPVRETRLWPHDHGPIYSAYDRLFDCRRHGWANLQAVHLNLPFAGEDEFARLMAAIRLVLPLIPCLAASSPVMEGEVTGTLDNRLDTYRSNSARVRAMTADVIPEPVYGFEEYRTRVLAPIDRELEARGADPVLLGQEWTNARGAIARFDRMAIEIRLIDVQEGPRADLAVSAAVAGLVRALVEERFASHAAQRDFPTEALVALLGAGIEAGPEAPLAHDGYRALFGQKGAGTGGALWRALGAEVFDGPAELEEPLRVVLERGVLAQRILDALGPDPDRARLRDVYAELCACPATGRSFGS